VTEQKRGQGGRERAKNGSKGRSIVINDTRTAIGEHEADGGGGRRRKGALASTSAGQVRRSGESVSPNQNKSAGWS